VVNCRFLVTERSFYRGISDEEYKKIAHLYERTFKVEKKLRGLAERYEAVYETRPNIIIGSIFKSKK